jgi:AraC-like DNA-binding protein
MPPLAIQRDLTPPPRGRPFWTHPTENGLFYLGWGQRYYGREPLQVTYHTGWSYAVILSGSPTLDLAQGRVVLKKGDICIIDPDCASGWSDRPTAVSEVLYWIWYMPPDASIAPAMGQVRQGRAGVAGRERLHRLHQECLHQVRLGDDYSLKALTGLRAQLDSEFARAFFGGKAPMTEQKIRFDVACRWLQENLARRGAIALLREYLDIGAADLHRLFREQTGRTPAQFLHRVRMDRARELLLNGRFSAKEVAFQLGYAHANDLSRALHRTDEPSPQTQPTQVRGPGFVPERPTQADSEARSPGRRGGPGS